MTLYISGKRADLDDASFLLLNWTQDEASSPATVRNSYSQSVTLQATPANNAIFGYFFRPDRVTADGGFDPLARTDYDLITETGDRVSKGYLKLDSVATGPGGIASYSVTLYGGLGGYFYALTNRTDGQKKSLADMRWVLEDDVLDLDEGMSMTAGTIKKAWARLGGSTAYSIFDIFNFAPCLNGIPESGFDAKHAVYRAGNTFKGQGYAGLYVSKDVDGATYTAATDDTILLNLPEAATEWEVQDLRAYLQRPVLRLREFLRSLEHFSQADTGYTLVLDSATFGGKDRWLDDVWLTLPLFDRESFDPATATITQIMKGTPSPGEVLVSVAKAMGWMFVYDDGDATVTLIDRRLYYLNNGADVINLEGRVAGDVTIEPNLMDRRFYTFGYKEVPGAFSAQYEETYGVQYGAQRVNTGYGFSDEETAVMDGTMLRGAADVLDTDDLYFYIAHAYTTGQGADILSYQFKFAYKGGVTWYLYNAEKGTIECSAYTSTTPAQIYYDNQDKGRHFMVLPQFCDDSRKAEDGSMCLLFFDAFADVPKYSAEDNIYLRLHLSNDTETMLYLNDYVPCWNVTLEASDDVVEVTRLPSFRRWKVNDEDAASKGVPTLDFGVPQAVGFPDPPEKVETLYDVSWRDYVSDRFDRDTKVLRAKVDLSGLEVGGSLLRRFYTWGGCLWSLNKIINYSLTTDDLTECEFVQVKDITNYTG